MHWPFQTEACELLPTALGKQCRNLSYLQVGLKHVQRFLMKTHAISEAVDNRVEWSVYSISMIRTWNPYIVFRNCFNRDWCNRATYSLSYYVHKARASILAHNQGSRQTSVIVKAYCLIKLRVYFNFFLSCKSLEQASTLAHFLPYQNQNPMKIRLPSALWDNLR